MHTAKNNNVGVCLSGLLSQCQTVAYEISQILNLTIYVVVSHDDCILFFCQSPYFCL